MSKFFLLLIPLLLLAGCSFQNNNSASSTEIPRPSALSEPGIEHQPILDGDIHNLLIKENNFSVDEINVTQGDVLILSIRNQLQEPINVVVDELNVKSKDIAFGELVEVTIPTDEPGEYEMYSSLGTQREDGFTALITIDEKSEE